MYSLPSPIDRGVVDVKQDEAAIESTTSSMLRKVLGSAEVMLHMELAWTLEGARRGYHHWFVLVSEPLLPDTETDAHAHDLQGGRAGGFRLRVFQSGLYSATLITEPSSNTFLTPEEFDLLLKVGASSEHGVRHEDEE
ncbi:unnamed protein product, partial [Amoebophrya sp. A25]|eukprot:GSA25T00008598001.1